VLVVAVVQEPGAAKSAMLVLVFVARLVCGRLLLRHALAFGVPRGPAKELRGLQSRAGQPFGGIPEIPAFLFVPTKFLVS